MNATVFSDAPAWPDQASPPVGHNQPPLEDQLVMEFEEELAREGIKGRIEELLESAAKAPPCTDQAVAGKIGDLAKLASDVRKRLDNAREKHNRPLLNAQRALKAKADGLYAPLATAVDRLRADLNRFMAEEREKADRERRRREEEARRIREEQERLARESAEKGEPIPEPIVEVEPVKVAEPVVRGDLGARVGTRTVWKHEIEVPIAKLPKAILDNEKVRAAVDQVIGAMVRGGTREIKGVRIWSDQVADVR